MDSNDEANRQKAEKLISSLKSQLKIVDFFASKYINNIAIKAEEAQKDANKTLKMSDANSLMAILDRVDKIIYSPELADITIANAQSAQDIQKIIDEMQQKVKTSIQQNLIEAYGEVSIEDDTQEKPTEANVSQASNQSSTTVENFFGDFVKRNIDGSRLNYEIAQLSLMQLSKEYAMAVSNPDFKGLDQVFENLEYICQDEENTNLIFAKMNEITPDQIDSVITKIKVGNYTEEQIKAVYEAVSKYDEQYNNFEKDFSGDEDKKEYKEDLINTIIQGNPNIEVGIPQDLKAAVRILSLEAIYARTLSDNTDDNNLKNFICDKIKVPDLAAPESLLDSLSTISEEMKQCPDPAKRLKEQRDRALISKIKNIPFLMNTIAKIIPGFEQTLAQFESQIAIDGATEALYAYLNNCVEAYQNGDYSLGINEIESYISYAQEENISFDDMIQGQEQVVQQEGRLLARSQAYEKEKAELDSCEVAQSANELDIKRVGARVGIKGLEGIFAFSANGDKSDIAHYNQMDLKSRENARESIFKNLSEHDYMILREKATEELESQNALIQSNSILRRVGAFFVNSIGRFLKLRNIPTKKEKAINNRIKRDYIREIMEENEKIQANYIKVAKEAEAIKEEEIALRDKNRERISKRKSKEKSKSTRNNNPQSTRQSSQSGR